MGWAFCGKDSFGREIGYAIGATCDWPGCENVIDRGLGYACGQMHGETEVGCEGYFCPEHLQGFKDGKRVCNHCQKPPSKQRKRWPLVEPLRAEGEPREASKSP